MYECVTDSDSDWEHEHDNQEWDDDDRAPYRQLKVISNCVLPDDETFDLRKMLRDIALNTSTLPNQHQHQESRDVEFIDYAFESMNIHDNSSSSNYDDLTDYYPSDEESDNSSTDCVGVDESEKNNALMDIQKFAYT